MGKKSKVVGSTCLAVGLLCSWDTAQAAQFTFTGSITPTHDLTDIYFVCSIGACQGGGTFASEIAASMPANVSTPFSVTINGVPNGLRNPGDPLNFTIASVYDPVNGGVSVAYDSNQAAALLAASPAPDWNGDFLPATNGNGSVYFQSVNISEADVATGLENGTFDSVLIGEYPGLAPLTVTPPQLANFTLVDFSDASNGGTGTIVETVPEPAILVNLIPAAAAIMLKRRRRKQIT
jgi:hypothetical protein